MTKRTTRRVRFALCLTARAGDDLISRKVYRVLPDVKAARLGCVRVIDESGEDYLYPADRFIEIDLPPTARGRLLAAAKG